LPKVLITTVPFGEKNRMPLDLLENAGIEFLINPLNKKLTEDQLAELIPDFDSIIAGTEPITEKVLGKASKLKHISRVGIGLDNVNLLDAQKRNIRVSYTPDAPAPAVADLTVGMMLSMLRSIHLSNAQLHEAKWSRIFGRRLGEVSIGIIGLGRIGKKVLTLLKGFGSLKIMVNDIQTNLELDPELNLEWATKEKIYKEADIVSLHVPLNVYTKNMIRKEHLLTFKHDAIIINTSRGGVINESNLYEVLKSGHLSGAAIDVFEKEPYDGPLIEIERCLLTAHMGSMSVDCRSQMEIESTKECILFLSGKPLKSEVPPDEYEIQRQGF